MVKQNTFTIYIYNNVHDVFFDGETKYFHFHFQYFHGNHIKYAIPAIVFLILIVIPPPLILLCDPILLKLEDKLC